MKKRPKNNIRKACSCCYLFLTSCALLPFRLCIRKEEGRNHDHVLFFVKKSLINIVLGSSFTLNDLFHILNVHQCWRFEERLDCRKKNESVDLPYHIKAFNKLMEYRIMFAYKYVGINFI